MKPARRMPAALAWLCLLALGCRATRPDSAPGLERLPPSVRQAVVVRRAAGPIHAASLSVYERGAVGWELSLGPWPAVVGRSGIVDAAQKREGDGGTPSGVHEVRLAFGYAPAADTRLDYRQASEDDYWVDEPASPSYNRWVKGKPDCSAERMRRDDAEYSIGCALEWNTSPPVPGRGSAIFFHVWRDAATATAGCVACEEAHVRAVLARLEPGRRPVFVVGG